MTNLFQLTCRIISQNVFYHIFILEEKSCIVTKERNIFIKTVMYLKNSVYVVKFACTACSKMAQVWFLVKRYIYKKQYLHNRATDLLKVCKVVLRSQQIYYIISLIWIIMYLSYYPMIAVDLRQPVYKQYILCRTNLSL